VCGRLSRGHAGVGASHLVPSPAEWLAAAFDTIETRRHRHGHNPYAEARSPGRGRHDVPLLDSAAGQPLLLLGGDGLGRDLLSRLLLDARTTLGVAFLAAIGPVLIGVLVGGVAGYAGGIVDETLMRFADLVLVLPPVLSTGTVFWCWWGC